MANTIQKGKGEVVALFHFFKSNHEGEVDRAINDHLGQVEVYAYDQFFIGRGNQTCRYVLMDPYISNHHVRIHSVFFDDNADPPLPPLVYLEDFSLNGTFLTRKTSGPNLIAQEHRVERGAGSVLLNHGDSISLAHRVLCRFFYLPRFIDRLSRGLTHLQRMEAELFKDDFTITNQKLGIGGHGAVFVAIQNKTNRQLACKVVRLSGLDTLTSNEALFDGDGSTNKLIDVKQYTGTEAHIRTRRQFREFDILKNLSHPNVIAFEKAYWSNHTLYIFEELITGGDLFSFLEFKGGRLNDGEAAFILLQILKALEYLHCQEIVHRDLKPDNILMTCLKDGSRLVLTDFGSSIRVEEACPNKKQSIYPKRRMFTVVGTVEYTAPEIFGENRAMPDKKGYSKAIDMWSLGCIASCLLSGDVLFIDRLDPRFPEDPIAVVLELANQCDLSMIENGDRWRLVGKRARDFVRRLLVLDETKRMTAKEAISHHWFTNPRNAKIFEDVYNSAVRDWRPRPKSIPLVEELKVDKLSYDIHNTDVSQRPSLSLLDNDTESSARLMMRRESFGERLRTSLPDIQEENEEEHGLSIDKTTHTAGNRMIYQDCGGNIPESDGIVGFSLDQLSIVQPPPTNDFDASLEFPSSGPRIVQESVMASPLKFQNRKRLRYPDRHGERVEELSKSEQKKPRL